MIKWKERSHRGREAVATSFCFRKAR